MNGTNEINQINEIDKANETGVLPVQTGHLPERNKL